MSNYGTTYRIDAIDGVTPLFRTINSWQGKIGSGFEKIDDKIDENTHSVRVLHRNFGKLKSGILGLPRKIALGFTAIPRALGPIGTAMAGAFTIGAISSFSRSVVSTMAEMERYEAVLGNTLGSASKAEAVFNKIQDFASSTPFQINNLTDSYVRLANQGFKPTMEEMRNLGDLAASHGKGFIQLSEAIIDAEVSEFKRLKEFGVRTQKNGDRIMFTYNGITTEVENSSAAIREYVLGLGRMDKNQGSMNKIAKTSAGLLSNLTDRWTIFKKELGEANKWLLELAVNGANKAINKLKVLVTWTEENKQMLQAYAREGFAKLVTAVKVAWKAISTFLKIIRGIYGWVIKNREQIVRLASILTGIGVVVAAVKIQMLGMAAVTTVISTLKALYTGLRSGILLTQAAQWLLNTAMIANPIGIIISAVGILLPLLIGLAAKFNFVREGLWNLAKFIFKFTPFGLLIEGLKHLIPGFRKRWGGFVKLVKKKLKKFLGGVSKLLNKFTSWLGLDGFDMNFTVGSDDSESGDNGNGDESKNNPSTDTTTNSKTTPKGKSVAERLAGVSASGSGGEIKNINVNIQNLVRQLVVEAADMTMARNKIKSEVSKALLAAVNDVNYQ